MKITLKLFATLSRHLPSGAEANAVRLEAEEGATAGELADMLGVPREAVSLVLVDGSAIPPEKMDETVLRDGQTLALWPPVAGG